MTKKDSQSSAGLSVGEISKRSGVSVSTIHFYEQKELISSTRNSGNQRRFKPSVLRRIAVIKTAQKLGISLKEISEAMAFLPTYESPTSKDWQKLSKRWSERLENRIKAMQALKSQLDECIGCGCLSIKVCKLRNPDDEASAKGNGPVFLPQLEDE